MARLAGIFHSALNRAFCITLVFLGLAVALLPQQGLAAGWSEQPRPESWVTNGTVTAMTQSGNTVYLGGDFTRLGPCTGGAVPLDTTTAQPAAVYPRVGGSVFACLADGTGGWFVGGVFTTVDGIDRDRIAHIRPDGTLDLAWNPGADGAVEALTLIGSTLYVGGGFATIGGQPRSCLAALDAATGQVRDWAPEPNGAVYAFGLSGSTLFVGGQFTKIGGADRSSLASFDTTRVISPNLPLPFSPWLDDTVFALCVSGSTVYAGGAFQTVNLNLDRQRLAAFDITTGTATAWNPQAGGTVYAMALSASTFYVGGSFVGIGGQRRNHAAAVTLGGAIAAWNPNADGDVRTLLLDGTTIYVGGDFVTIHGQACSYLAALDTTSAQPTSWAPQPNNTVLALARAGSTLYAGGTFSSVGGVTRSHLAAIDSVTGQPTPFAPNPDGAVHALAITDTTLYSGGTFQSIGGSARFYLAAIDTSTGLVTAWNPQPNNTIEALAAQGTAVYAGGTFSSIGADTRNRIACISTTSGLATAWDPGANGAVRALAVAGTRLYAGGDFSNISSAPLSGIAALDTQTAAPVPAWDAHSNGSVTTIVPAGATIYVAGDFLVIGGQKFHYFAELNGSDGSATSWDPSVSDAVNAVALAGADVLVGGAFANIGNGSSSYIAALSRASATARAWNPLVGGPVNAIAGVSASSFWIGGGFTTVGGVPRRGLAQFGATYGVTFVTDGTLGATLTGATVQTIVAGADSTSVTAVAPPGCHFVGWTLDGADYSRANPLKVTDVRRDMALVAVFSSGFTLTFATDGTPGAYLQGATHQTVPLGANATTVTAVVPPDFGFLRWELDGAPYSTNTTIHVLNVQSDMSFVAVYSSSVFAVTFGTGSVPGTTLTGATPQFIQLGGDCTPVRVNPPRGHHFVKWLANGADYATTNPVTVTGVTQTMTLTPVLAPDAGLWILK